MHFIRIYSESTYTKEGARTMKVLVVDPSTIEVITNHANITIRIYDKQVMVDYFDHDTNTSWTTQKDLGEVFVI